MNLQNTFQKFNQVQKSRGPWSDIRLNGFRYFEKHGLPSKQDEAWKYTSLKSLPEALLQPQENNTLVVPKDLKNELEAYLSPQFFHLVFLNGVLVPEHSDLSQLSKLKIVGLEDVEHTSVLSSIQKARKQAGPIRQDAMEALNSAFAHSGLVIEVPKNTSLPKPLQILFYQTSEKASYQKVLVKVGSGSKLVLLESYVGAGQKSLTDSVSEFVVEPAAKLEYTRVQEEGSQTIHVGCTRVFLQQDSSFEALSYATGASVSRHNFDIYCLGPQAFAQINGLTLGTGSQHHDNRTLIDHVVGSCNTTQLYKSILDDQSRAVFNGRVQIRQDAQKANSEQLNNNLILNSQAEADSKPELAIYADDVKASHGSTVGQLNPEELFYFLSRCIPRSKAIEMLSLGFVNDLIDRVTHDDVREWLAERLLKAYQKVKGHLQ